MKAERRHELQTNSLANALGKFPDFWARHGTRLLIGLVIVALVAVFLYNRSARHNAEISDAQQAIVMTQSAIDHLQQLSIAPAPDTETRLNQFKQAQSAITDQLNIIVGVSDPAILSQALLLRGDYNWTLATYPELPGATTQPALALPVDREATLALAAESYTSALNSYANQPLVKARALFGLAAIAEEKGDWASARSHYQSIVDDAGASDTLRTLATERLKSLDDLQKPMFVAATTRPAAAVAPVAPAPATEAAPAPIEAAPEAPAPTEAAPEAPAEPADAATPNPAE